MKKSKKIPKTHLPKFSPGGKTTMLSNGNEVSMYGTGPTQGTDATSNLYNEKRSSGMTTQQKNDMYAAIGAAGASYAMANNQAAYADPNYQLNNSSKGAWQSQGSSEGVADSIQSGVASAIPQAALFHGLSESAQSAVGTQGANAGAQYFFEPHKLITHAIDGEGLFNAKDREEHGLGKLNNLTHAYGGKSITPNAEIEKQENVVAPNGGFLQANGPSHEQGGVPVALPGNSMIFSDRLKLGKKTFAELNKVNNTSKEDKILESNKYGNTSKRTAELMKFAKNKNSEELFNAQEALKQAKVEAYAKKMGVNLNQSPEVPQEFAMGGVKLPKFFIGGRYVDGVWVEDNQPMGGFQADAWQQPRGPVNNTEGNSKTEPFITNEDFNKFKETSGKAFNDQIVNQSDKNKVMRSNEARKIQANIMSGNSQYLPDNNNPANNPNLKKTYSGTEVSDSDKFDWKGLGSNVAMGLANNAGNIYNLSRYNKPEVEAYERMKATYLDPSAALRDAEAQTRRAEYNVRGASGGNAGTYLSNRVALNAQNTINKARIHTDYQNANAGIANSVGQYNNELARQEVIANAMNRARNRSGKGEAIGSLGSNIANQMMDNKKTNMDQETLQLMMKYYNDPQFKKYLEESGYNKKKTGK